MIIQSAAHEDANIIFGAVQDESMGDEIKITVIATGFKQNPADAMGERRERMLGEASLPEFVQEPIRVQSRPKLSRRTEDAAPRFASEVEEEITVTLEPEELRAVPASVFDDEFFRSTMRSVAERENEAEVEASEREDDVVLASASDYMQERQEREQEQREREQKEYEATREAAREAARAMEAETRMQAELAAERAAAAERPASYPARTLEPMRGDAEPAYAESDELDIPAFLRRSSS